MATEASGSDRQIITAIGVINLTLSMLASRDQRVGAKALYKDEDFTRIVRDYYSATLDVASEQLTASERMVLSVCPGTS